MKKLDSLENPVFKKAKKLKEKKNRLLTGKILVEGPVVISEILPFGMVERLFYREGEEGKMEEDFSLLKEASLPKNILSKKLFSQLQGTESSQGVIAMVKNPVLPFEGESIEGKYLYVDGIQDPGNLGGMIRSCEAFSFDGVFLGPNTVESTNPKAIRSSMASLFRLPIYTIEDEALQKILAQGTKMYVLDLGGTAKLEEIKEEKNIILVVGNEAKGPRVEIKKWATDRVEIPLSENVDSLNANVAASIAMYVLQGGNS
ncbi:RNA methyltransferase [Peptoniphilus sp. KCTC 25270]|uniref:TrmH family RNA methyltransferase n=1 Tax=Peptoniphilus sp. KCTC 25270 TaxID=2897414 RepID=UPI001E3BC780|nr:RNA methyltransferase [Peptoniphilus sp. KCTC 25270]MCD1147162.1 RNA methyltransferase [Peptoniphilus sp. KCTC 25270]